MIYETGVADLTKPISHVARDGCRKYRHGNRMASAPDQRVKAMAATSFHAWARGNIWTRDLNRVT